MNNKEVANKYGVALNLRGRARRAGVKTAEYVRVNGKQNMIIIGSTLILFLLVKTKSNIWNLQETLQKDSTADILKHLNFLFR